MRTSSASNTPTPLTAAIRHGEKQALLSGKDGFNRPVDGDLLVVLLRSMYFKGTETRIADFPTPDDLWRRYQAAAGSKQSSA